MDTMNKVNQSQDDLGVYVGNLPNEIEECDILDLIKDFDNAQFRRLFKKEHKVFCFLHCENEREIVRLVHTLDKTKFKGRVICVRALNRDLQNECDRTRYERGHTAGVNQMRESAGDCSFKDNTQEVDWNDGSKFTSNFRANYTSNEIESDKHSTSSTLPYGVRNSVRSNNASILSGSKSEEYDQFQQPQIRLFDKGKMPLGRAANLRSCKPISPVSTPPSHLRNILNRPPTVAFNHPPPLAFNQPSPRASNPPPLRASNPPPLRASNPPPLRTSNQPPLRTSNQPPPLACNQPFPMSYNHHPPSASKVLLGRRNEAEIDPSLPSSHRDLIKNGPPPLKLAGTVQETGPLQKHYPNNSMVSQKPVHASMHENVPQQQMRDSSSYKPNYNQDFNDSHTRMQACHISPIDSRAEYQKQTFRNTNFSPFNDKGKDKGTDKLNDVKPFTSQHYQRYPSSTTNATSPELEPDHASPKNYSDDSLTSSSSSNQEYRCSNKIQSVDKKLQGYPQEKPIQQQNYYSRARPPQELSERNYTDECCSQEPSELTDDIEGSDTDYSQTVVLCVSNFPFHTTEEDIYALFEDFDPVEIWIESNRYRKGRCTEAYVVVPNEKLALEAIMQRDNTEYERRTLLVTDVQEADDSIDDLMLLHQAQNDSFS